MMTSLLIPRVMNINAETTFALITSGLLDVANGGCESPRTSPVHKSMRVISSLKLPMSLCLLAWVCPMRRHRRDCSPCAGKVPTTSRSRSSCEGSSPPSYRWHSDGKAEGYPCFRIPAAASPSSGSMPNLQERAPHCSSSGLYRLPLVISADGTNQFPKHLVNAIPQP